jgi:hypothetical protein
MRIASVVLLACLTTALCFGQSSSSSSPSSSRRDSPSKYQAAQIVAAKVHQPMQDSRVVRYDVTVQVADTEYVVLYTPPEGIDVVEYKLGQDGLVLVAADNIKWYDMLGRPHEAPILRRRTIPPKTQPAK